MQTLEDIAGFPKPCFNTFIIMYFLSVLISFVYFYVIELNTKLYTIFNILSYL